MDEAMIQFVVTGILAGAAGATVQGALLLRSIRKKNNAAAFSKAMLEHVSRSGTEQGGAETVHFQQDILSLFDDFMANRLTQKMPVLNLFIDEKLIAEIRVVFHDEMEKNLPALLRKNMTDEKNISIISDLFTRSVSVVQKSLLRKSILHLFIGALTGGIVGLLAGALFQ